MNTEKLNLSHTLPLLLCLSLSLVALRAFFPQHILLPGAGLCHPHNQYAASVHSADLSLRGHGVAVLLSPASTRPQLLHRHLHLQIRQRSISPPRPLTRPWEPLQRSNQYQDINMHQLKFVFLTLHVLMWKVRLPDIMLQAERTCEKHTQP